jgi:hypothetical protein
MERFHYVVFTVQFYWIIRYKVATITHKVYTLCDPKLGPPLLLHVSVACIPPSSGREICHLEVATPLVRYTSFLAHTQSEPSHRNCHPSLYMYCDRILHTGRQCEGQRPVWTVLLQYIYSDGWQFLWDGSDCVCAKNEVYLTSGVAALSGKSLSLMMVVYVPPKHVGVKDLGVTQVKPCALLLALFSK